MGLKVKDLIALLQRCDQDAPVTVWHPYHDNEDFDVRVSIEPHIGANVHIGTDVFGEEVVVDHEPPPQKPI